MIVYTFTITDDDFAGELDYEEEADHVWTLAWLDELVFILFKLRKISIDYRIEFENDPNRSRELVKSFG